MAATVAHELRQPLQVITASCELAREEVHDPDYVAQKLDRIDGQIARATRIVEDLRVFSRGTAGEAPLPFAVGAAVRTAIDLTAGAARRAGLAVTPSVAAALPTVLGHRARLEQVLINLINNARDAGAHDVRIAVELSMARGAPMVRIAVSDDGPGIPEDLLPRLFHSFVTTKPAGKGTGQGLRICQRLVQEMGGTIRAANHAGGGAEFVILLPAIRGD
jgi:signal transduction histidine kinase